MANHTILVLGATGMLGRPVADQLAQDGHSVRVLVRNPEKARRMITAPVEIFKGSADQREDLQRAMTGCDTVHISLPQEIEMTAARLIVELASENPLRRISYVSATTAIEENRWFPLIDAKLKTEEMLKASGIPLAVFCPTWVMESLNNFVQEDRVVVLQSKNPPPLHFFAADDFGRIVADSYTDDRAIGMRLFVHGPEALTLPKAIEKYADIKNPDVNKMRLKLWQARLIATLTGRKPLMEVTNLVTYFDKVGELGDPAETNIMYGAPPTTLDEWIAAQ